MRRKTMRTPLWVWATLAFLCLVYLVAFAFLAHYGQGWVAGKLSRAGIPEILSELLGMAVVMCALYPLIEPIVFTMHSFKEDNEKK